MTVLPLKGRELQKAAVRLAQHYGWLVATFPPIEQAKGGWRTSAGANAKGWPDIFAIRSERVLIREVKGDGDRLSAEQQRWLDLFLGASLDAAVWTPTDWRDGTVDRELR
jgi:hypothetical protein